jgi:hypothetical protein
MGNLLKVVIFVCGMLFTFTIIMFLVKRKINERNTLVWLSGCFVILILSTMPDTFDRLAVLVGVKYPPSLLFLISTLVILIIVLYQSIQISMLTEKLKELAQNVAVLSFKDQKDKRSLLETEHLEE